MFSKAVEVCHCHLNISFIALSNVLDGFRLPGSSIVLEEFRILPILVPALWGHATVNLAPSVGWATELQFDRTFDLGLSERKGTEWWRTRNTPRKTERASSAAGSKKGEPKTKKFVSQIEKLEKEKKKKKKSGRPSSPHLTSHREEL